MGTDMGTARDDADTSADADAILRLIMSGQPPKAATAQTDASSLPGPPPVGISPVDADPFWAAPPATSSDTTAPRVEALFTRGVTYQTADSSVIETEDIASIGEEVVAELTPSPIVEQRAEEVEPVILENAAQESELVVEPAVVYAPVVETPKRKPSTFRPLPTPTSRTLGADFVRDVDDFEVIEASEPDDTSRTS